MRLCGPLLLGLLLLSLPAWAQVERNTSDLTSRQRADGASHRGGWISPDHEEAESEAAPVWNYRQEQAVRRVFRAITADGQHALARFSNAAPPESGGRQTIVAQTIPPKPELPHDGTPAFRLKREQDVAAEFPEFVEETSAAAEDTSAPAQAAAPAEAGEAVASQAMPEAAELPDTDQPQTPADAEAAVEANADAAAEAARTAVGPEDDNDTPAFRIRPDRDGSRQRETEFDFPAEDASQPAEDSAAARFPDADVPEAAADDEARIDRGFIPDSGDARPAQLKPASGSLARPGGVQAPLALPDNPGRISDYNIRSDISKITRGNSRLKQVALTFDDGPHPEYTGQLLTILEYYNCPATFFFVGVQANRYPQWVQMAHQQGHEIASQTYDHFRLPKLPKGEKEYQIDAYQDLIEDLVGERPRFLRPPGGQIDDASIELLKQRGIVCAMWDVALNDTHGDKNGDELLEHTLDKVRNGSVILAHDGVQATIDMLPELIERLREEGYELVTMSELASKL